MTGRVFISYRSAVSANLAREVTNRIDDVEDLRAVKDVRFIKPADPIRTVISAEIDRADLVLVLIGPGWQIRSLDPAEDYVGFELGTAARLGKIILPVLHGGASMPERQSLPTGLALLSDELAETISMSDRSHPTDMERLLVEVKRLAVGNMRRCLVVAANDQAPLAREIQATLTNGGLDMMPTYIARKDNFQQMSSDARRCHALVAISSERDSDGTGDDLADPLVYAELAYAMIYPVITDRPRSRFGGTYPGMQGCLDLRSSQHLPSEWIAAICEGRNYPT